jgi:Flp pilus assembly protein TadG
MRHSRKTEKGATAVEMAFALPVLLLLIFAVAEFGRYFFVQHTLQFGTREGMRLALVGGILTGGDGNPLSREESIRRKIRESVSAAVNPADVAINFYYAMGSDYNNDDNWNEATNPGNPGQYMRVTTSYTYRFITPLIGSFFPAGVNEIRTQCTYRNELFD